MLVIKATRAELDGDVVARVTEVLRQWTGDLSLEITDIHEGSVRLTIAVSPTGATRLVERWRAGQAAQLCGFDISAVVEPPALELLPRTSDISIDVPRAAHHTISSVDASSGHPVPGAVAVWTGTRPVLQVFRVPPAGLVLGRELLRISSLGHETPAASRDDRISGKHAHIARDGDRFLVTDLGSRNGTYIDGDLVIGSQICATAPVIMRTGRTIWVLVNDVRRFEGALVAHMHDSIIGPTTAGLWHEVTQIARAGGVGENLTIVGEFGSGKRLLARQYGRVRHDDAVGFNPVVQPSALEQVVRPETRTVILEEVGNLTARDHASLARLIERPTLRFVTPTIVPLHELALPSDLAAALSTRKLVVPPLRERLDEMAFLVEHAVRSAARRLEVHATLVEHCLLRPWPGNVQELTFELDSAAQRATERGRSEIRWEDLRESSIRPPRLPLDLGPWRR